MRDGDAARCDARDQMLNQRNRTLFWTYCRRGCRRQIPPASWGRWPANWQSRRSSQTPAGPGWGVTWSPPPCADLETDAAFQCLCAASMRTVARPLALTEKVPLGLRQAGRVLHEGRDDQAAIGTWKCGGEKRQDRWRMSPSRDIWKDACEHTAESRQGETLALAETNGRCGLAGTFNLCSHETDTAARGEPDSHLLLGHGRGHGQQSFLISFVMVPCAPLGPNKKGSLIFWLPSRAN